MSDKVKKNTKPKGPVSSPVLPPLTRSMATSVMSPADSGDEWRRPKLSDDGEILLRTISQKFDEFRSELFSEFKEEIFSLLNEKTEKVKFLEQQIVTLQRVNQSLCARVDDI